MRRGALERCDGLFRRREDVILANLRGQAESLELGPHSGTNAGDGKDHLPLLPGCALRFR